MFPFFTECVQPTHAASHFLQAFLEMQLSYEPHMSACLVGWIGGPYFLKRREIYISVAPILGACGKLLNCFILAF